MKAVTLSQIMPSYPWIPTYNVPINWDKNASANSADPNQTVPQEQSDKGLHCLKSLGCPFSSKIYPHVQTVISAATQSRVITMTVKVS